MLLMKKMMEKTAEDDDDDDLYSECTGTLWPEKEGNLKLRNGLETRQSAIHHSLPHHHHPNHHKPKYIS